MSTVPLSVVCWRWKWRGEGTYRSDFTADRVHVLRNMVRRHYPDPHRFICCTDDPSGLDANVEVVPLWDDYADLPHPWSPTHPSCYRRLKAFAPDIEAVFGPRFVSLDLDCVILDDLRPLWNRPEPFVGLAGTQPPTTFNGSMFLLSAGSRSHVWTSFDPRTSPRQAKLHGHYGSDQAWISLVLGETEPRWTTNDGVYTYRLHVATLGNKLPQTPAPRIVFFSGKKDPWSPGIRDLDWVKGSYR